MHFGEHLFEVLLIDVALRHGGQMHQHSHEKETYILEWQWKVGGGPPAQDAFLEALTAGFYLTKALKAVATAVVYDAQRVRGDDKMH